LLPLLAPLVAVLLTGALNPRPTVALRLLTWTSPALPLGVWLAAMAAGGAALSGGATALALRDPSPALRRQVRRNGAPEWDGDDLEGSMARERQPGRSSTEAAADGRGPRQAARQPQAWDSQPQKRHNEPSSAGPSRAPGEPAPTVSVPFRVIRAPVGTSGGARVDQGQRQARERIAEPAVDPGWDDWGNDALEQW
jgi:hypothetical protein